MNVPGWLRDAIATPRGFISKKGELLKAVRMTAAQCDEHNNRKKEEPKTISLDLSTAVPTVASEPVVEVEFVVEDEMTDTHSDIEITVTGADEDGDGVLSEDELKKLTKAKLESVARDYGIEIDRRKSKKALLEELLEKIA
jgi:hypothetical protein